MSYQGTTTYLGQVATGCFAPRKTVTGAGGWARTRDLVITTEAVTNPRVGYAGWYVQNGQEAANADPATILVAMEYPAGVLTYANQCLAAGGAGAPVPFPSNAVTLLDFNITLPARAQVYMRVLQVAPTANAGWLYHQGQHPLNARPGCYLNNGTGTPPALTDPMTGSYSEYSFPPTLFLGQTTRPSVLIFGDSREEGGQEGPRPPFYDSGMVTGALGRHFGYINVAESSTQMTTTVNGPAAARAGRLALARYVSHVVNAWNVNDIGQNRSPATVAADRATFAGFFPGNTVVGVTCQPFTSSTDGWATLANQPGGGFTPAIRQLNRLVRAGIPGEAIVLDVAQATDPMGRDRWPVASDPGAAASGSACTFTGSIPASSTVLTVTAVQSGALALGQTVTEALDYHLGYATDTPFAGTTVLEQLSGTTGGVGTYTVSVANPHATPSQTMYAGAAWATKDGLHGNGLMAEQVRVRLAADIAQIRR